MSVTPNSILNKNKNLKKRINIDKINLDDVAVNDLKFNGDNYEKYINLMSLLENVSVCQVSDAYNESYKRSGTIKSIKPINNLKVWGKIFTAETDSDDWGTSALAIDEAESGDVLFFKVSDDDKAIWGELASVCAKDNGINATVIYGSARDLDALLDMDYPIFASNFVPNAGSAIGLGSLNKPLDIEGVKINPGDFFLGDETGIVIIPQEIFADVMSATLDIKLKETSIIGMINDGISLAQITGLRDK